MTRYRLPADDLEYAVLSLLWHLGTASVRSLHEGLGAPAGRAYTTTAKVVDRLREKGLIMRRRETGGFVYSPAVDPQDVDRARARHLFTRFLGATPHGAVAALVDAVDDMDPELLDHLERAIEAKRRAGHGT